MRKIGCFHKKIKIYEQGNNNPPPHHKKKMQTIKTKQQPHNPPPLPTHLQKHNKKYSK